MKSLRKALHSLLFKAPVAIAIAIVNLTLLLVLALPALLLLVFEALIRFLHKMNLKEEEHDAERCNPPLPEDVMRRPDPCIYSQRYLASQGLPVTWNNPDIWVAKASTPGTIEPDSYHLAADTDYIVTVQVHNASTDVGLGVKVRLLYRPWSFNSPELLPVEVDSNGNEVVRFVNVGGMSAATTAFAWRTPPIGAGQSQHFCLQAHVSHPLDLNPENNMGQENTDVHGLNPGHVRAGERVDVEVPLFNHAARDAAFVFNADAYEITADDRFELRLERNTGVERWPLSRKLGTIGLSLRQSPRHSQPKPRGDRRRAAASYRDRWQVGLGRRARMTVRRARYTGYEALRAQLLASDHSLPPGMTFEVPGGVEGFVVERGATRPVPIRIDVPTDASTGQRYSINATARRSDGIFLGGVTIVLEVEN